ncbi:hypothetical protein N781_07660 [Pontibacillus halophilus JSM 076056 = DSM 19796]|uniref:Spore coat protein YutH n=1 Tax=Pontibacillus halophilus JSM 076056 = DSM 19796 TaxID=1385510 RepID=A0A0A5GET5_9BACI|nr:spore coat protein YutH [Pontibacillus halophilus]KGX89630.1 hypothetical protein N781_07660 [Pontibacillus halophilus JSM 076056 = DSM 19796]
MKEWLEQTYLIHVYQKVYGSLYEGYSSTDGNFFIVPVPGELKEEAYEQRSLAEFLRGAGMEQVGLPVFNQEGQLLSDYENRKVMCVHTVPHNGSMQQGLEMLASLHQLGAQYPYQPQYVSRYGEWKSLWEQKMDKWHELYEKQWSERPSSSYQRLVIETFPYIEGLTENAIQYLQETEQDWRYEEGDQGTVTFQRFQFDTFNQPLWPTEFVYDHRARDLAEGVRTILLQQGKDGLRAIRTLIGQYESVSQLSVFTWRMIYGRLLMPIHLFDRLEEVIIYEDKQNARLVHQFKELMQQQVQYESALKHFFHELGVDQKQLRIPIPHWLS